MLLNKLLLCPPPLLPQRRCRQFSLVLSGRCSSTSRCCALLCCCCRIAAIVLQYNTDKCTKHTSVAVETPAASLLSVTRPPQPLRPSPVLPSQAPLPPPSMIAMPTPLLMSTHNTSFIMSSRPSPSMTPSPLLQLDSCVSSPPPIQILIPRLQ